MEKRSKRQLAEKEEKEEEEDMSSGGGAAVKDSLGRTMMGSFPVLGRR